MVLLEEFIFEWLDLLGLWGMFFWVLLMSG